MLKEKERKKTKLKFMNILILWFYDSIMIEDSKLNKNEIFH
jgi:hypothetical protein